MIETKKLTKRFGDITAVDRINARIQDANVFGLIGTNGAGKSTFLRLLCGILKPEEGCVLVDGSPVYENEDLKRNIFYISDDQLIWPGRRRKIWSTSALPFIRILTVSGPSASSRPSDWTAAEKSRPSLKE